MSTIILDLETAPLPDAARYLEPPEPHRGLKDPAKIAADRAEKTARQQADCALDWHVGRIVAIGTLIPPASDITARYADTEPEERDLIVTLWDLLRAGRASGDNPVLVGFGLRRFDLPYLVMRSHYLEISPLPRLDLSRYARDGRVLDLYDVLTCGDDRLGAHVMRRSLQSFARRFGLATEDQTTGADIPALVAAGHRQAVLAHLREDVRLIAALAQRLGLP